jgi:hypothetical protein
MKKKAQTKMVIETDEKLIKAVATELNTSIAPMILSKLQDIETALYHLAAKVKDIGDAQARLEQISVGMSTTMEEVLHDLEGDDQGPSEHDFLPDSTLN